jgi:hypothetical protein
MLGSQQSACPGSAAGNLVISVSPVATVLALQLKKRASKRFEIGEKKIEYWLKTEKNTANL